jgi:hypothetical protein
MMRLAIVDREQRLPVTDKGVIHAYRATSSCRKVR